MPQWNIDEAIQIYEQKLSYAEIIAKITAKISQMQERTTSWQSKLATIQGKAGKILSDFGVPTIQRGSYIQYLQDVDLAMRKYHPSVWAYPVDYMRELKVIADRWAARGLNKEIMKKLAHSLGCWEIDRYLT